MKIYIVFTGYEDFMDGTIADFSSIEDIPYGTKKAIFLRKENAEAFLSEFRKKLPPWKDPARGEIHEYEVI